MNKNDATREEIKAFLDLLQSRMRYLGSIVSYDPRDKNRDFLAAMEWRSAERDKWLLQLVLDDYYEGPLPNSDEYGEDLWVFGKMIQNELCYIKIYFLKNPNIFCISFHFAEFDMYLPLPGVTLKKTHEDQ